MDSYTEVFPQNCPISYATLFEENPMMLIIIDPAGTIISANKFVAEQLGYAQEELLGTSVLNIFFERDRATVEQQIKYSLKNSQQIRRWELRKLRKDGSLIWVREFARSLSGSDGAQYILISCEDITARKMADERIAKLNRELQRRVAELETIHNTAPIGIAICYDLQCANVKGNPVMAEMLGLPAHDGMWVTAQLAAQKKFKFMRDGSEIPAEELPMKIAIARGITVKHATLDIVHDDGRKITIYGNAAPLFDEDGKPSGVVGAFMDITELKRAEGSIEELNAKLKKKVIELEYAFSELDAFSYSVSHDLNAPLRRIDNYCSMMRDKSGDTTDKNIRSYLTKMKENVDQMKELIGALLALSRVSRKKMESSDIDLGETARKIFTEMRADFPDRDISLDVKDMPHALGDKVLLNQVMINLLSNACKFTEDTDPSLIEVGGWAEFRENVYYVKDNGIGFNMKFANRIFNVFQRLHTAEEFEGAGIGLSIVQRAILRHGGRVWSEGKPGEGATFYFTLPRKEAV